MTIFILLKLAICMERLKAWEMGQASSGGLGFGMVWIRMSPWIRDFSVVPSGLVFVIRLRIGFYPILHYVALSGLLYISYLNRLVLKGRR